MPDANELPIRRYQDDIVAAVAQNDTVVVIGETGSGKTTQISQILLEAGYGKDGIIAVTQPRRVGAVTVAKRVAEERGCELGDEVGYAVRFEDRSSPRTRIKYMTDGTLLREFLEDPQVQHYSVIVLDEAHERSLNTDVLFGVLKRLVKSRQKPLKLVITSATLDGEKFSMYFHECPVFNVPGRCFPVDIIHTTEDHHKDFVSAAVDTALQLHLDQPPGDILVFLTGQAEIEKAIHKINDGVASMPEGSCGPLMVLPLHASLPPDMQVRVFRKAPEGVRRCIVATNVAETSVTVEGVVYVVDSGVVKQKHYQAATGMDSLDVVPIARVGATQRAGRAGRTRPGKCFRLYTQAYFDKQMPNVALPEIQRTSLVAAVLYLKSLQLDIDVVQFDFLDPPGTDVLEDALRQLYILEAIDADGEITPLGRKMSSLPLEPALARALTAARKLRCLPELMSVAAMLSAERVFAAGQGAGDAIKSLTAAEAQQQRGHDRAARAQLQALMAEGLGDHVLLLRLWEAWAARGCSKDAAAAYGLDLRGMNFARDVRRQLEGIVGPDGSGLELGHKSDKGSSREGQQEHPQHKRGADWDTSGAAAESKRPRTNASSAAQQQDESAVRDRQTGSDQHQSHRQSNHNRQKGYDGHPIATKASAGSGGGKNGLPALSDSERINALRHALTIGFANKLARRLPRHNAYKTLNSASGQLAQLHPSCAELRQDEDGMPPEWIIYHELVSTSRPYLRQVCATHVDWVQKVLPRLMGVDVKRLSKNRFLSAREASAATALTQAGAGSTSVGSVGTAAEAGQKRKDAGAVNAARDRYLQRKASLPAATRPRKP